jgi:hypothetical protein
LSVANVGFQMSGKPYLEFEVAPKLSVGASVPIAVGFNNGAGNAFAQVSFISVDIMPGVRASYALLDWVFAGLDVGLGPHILTTKVDVPFINMSQTTTKTFFATRVGLGVMVAPPQLPGLTFGLTPLELDARVGDGSYSEYRLSVSIGYRH